MPKAGKSLLIHLIWQVADPVAAPLTREMLGRLPQYVIRYAETLGTRVLACGGVANHIHVLLDLAPSRTLQSVEDELLRSTQRFMRDLTGVRTFAWAPDRGSYMSVSASECDTLLTYIAAQSAIHEGAAPARAEWEAGGAADAPPAEPEEEALPEWLRSAMGPQR